MSFSREVKEELLKKIDSARHCRIAELSAIIAFSGEIYTDPQGRNKSENILGKFGYCKKVLYIAGKNV